MRNFKSFPTPTVKQAESAQLLTGYIWSFWCGLKASQSWPAGLKPFLANPKTRSSRLRMVNLQLIELRLDVVVGLELGSG